MVFRLDKKKIAQCFRRSLLTYDDAAIVQNKLAGRLIQSLDCLPETAFHRVLEIGCCTGGLSELLCAEKTIQILYLNDLVSDFEDVVFSRLKKHTSTQLIPYFGDIETLQLPSNLSCVLSGATFQWLGDLSAFIEHLGRELQTGAFLAFSMFGQGTLKEFSSLTSVELHYHSDDEILALLEQNFIIESYESYGDQLFFQSVREILNHIRETGVGGVSEFQWKKETLKQFEELYVTEFGGEKGLPVSYASSCYVARRR
jgi:malonyl-ACP O-methyltransferase BioC